MKWVFPSARLRYSPVFQEEISEWFDIASLTDPEKENEGQREGLRESVEYVAGIVREEARELEERHGSSKGRVILGGISMGEAVSVHVLLYLLSQGDESVGGYFGWCGWLPFRGKIMQCVEVGKGVVERRSVEDVMARLRDFCSKKLGLPSLEATSEVQDDQRLTSVPVFLSHCTDDGVVSIGLGRQVKTFLIDVGLKVSWEEYERADHWIRREAMDVFEEFLDEKISRTSTTAIDSI